MYIMRTKCGQITNFPLKLQNIYDLVWATLAQGVYLLLQSKANFYYL